MRSSTAALTNDSVHYSSGSPPPTQGRSKRWATHSVDEHLSGDEEHEEQDVDDEIKPRSKRARASNASNASASSSRGAATGGTAKGSTSAGGSSSAQGPVSANDKEQRKQARMIRNRSEFKSTLSVCRIDPRRTNLPRSSRTAPVSRRCRSSIEGSQEGAHPVFGVSCSSTRSATRPGLYLVLGAGPLSFERQRPTVASFQFDFVARQQHHFQHASSD